PRWAAPRAAHAATAGRVLARPGRAVGRAEDPRTTGARCERRTYSEAPARAHTTARVRQPGAILAPAGVDRHTLAVGRAGAAAFAVPRAGATGLDVPRAGAG